MGSSKEENLLSGIYWPKALSYIKNEDFRSIQEKAKHLESEDDLIKYLYCLVNGIGTKKSFKEAFKLAQEGTAKSFISCNYYLGVFYIRGLGVKSNLKQAYLFLNKANDYGYSKEELNKIVVHENSKIRDFRINFKMKGLDKVFNIFVFFYNRIFLTPPRNMWAIFYNKLVYTLSQRQKNIFLRIIYYFFAYLIFGVFSTIILAITAPITLVIALIMIPIDLVLAVTVGIIYGILPCLISKENIEINNNDKYKKKRISNIPKIIIPLTWGLFVLKPEFINKFWNDFALIPYYKLFKSTEKIGFIDLQAYSIAMFVSVCIYSLIFMIILLGIGGFFIIPVGIICISLFAITAIFGNPDKNNVEIEYNDDGISNDEKEGE